MPGDADGSICVEAIDNLFLSNARYWYCRTVQSAGYRSAHQWSTCYRETQVSICDLFETFRSRFDMLRDLGRHLCVGCSLPCLEVLVCLKVGFQACAGLDYLRVET